MACNFKNVLAQNAACKENPAGVANYCMVVPLDSEYISTIGVHDGSPEYVITGPGKDGALIGYRIDFHNQTGQVTSEDNGDGKAWSHHVTFRADKNAYHMAYMSRVLHNSGGKFLVFLPTGNMNGDKIEWRVVGNQFGESEWGVAADSGAARSDDHGQTVTVTCGYQLYPEMYWNGIIETAQDPSSSEMADDITDNITIGDNF